MTESLATTTPGVLDPDDEDLARLVQLEHQLGRQPGRPLIIKHLGVSDSRARKLIAARNAGTGASTSDHQPPAGATSIRQLAPAAATSAPGNHHHLHAVPTDHQQPAAEDHSAVGTDHAITESTPSNQLETEEPAAPDETVDATPDSKRSPDGAGGFYLVAFLALLVSVDTSWRFFGHELGITNLAERAVMFSVIEAALIACGFAMRAGVRRTGQPGPARWVAWSLCGLSGYMALVLSGPLTGVARVALGPLLSLTMLHLALGIEIRATRRTQATTWTRIRGELRERALSRLGLANDQRDALAHTRDRAARRAAKLAATSIAPLRHARLARALRVANVAHDRAACDRMIAELATAKHASELRDLSLPSPWSGSYTPDGSSRNERAPA